MHQQLLFMKKHDHTRSTHENSILFIFRSYTFWSLWQGEWNRYQNSQKWGLKDNFIPLAIKTYGCLHSCFDFFLLLVLSLWNIVKGPFFFLRMLISYHWQCVSIDFSAYCCVWEAIFISFTHCNQCTSIIGWFVTNYAFLTYDLLFYYCTSGVLIVFFHDLCSEAFICLVLLVDGFPSLPFLCTKLFFFFSFKKLTLLNYLQKKGPIALWRFSNLWFWQCLTISWKTSIELLIASKELPSCLFMT
jgi:hypothetical protein